MSLLADLMAGKGLDPGYEEAAARGPRRATRHGRAVRLVAATAVLGLLGAVAVIQVRRGEPVAQRQREALIGQIRDRTEQSDALQRQAERLRADTEKLRQTALASSDEGRAARRRLDAVAAMAAAAPVAGKGVVVTVADARNRRDEDGRIYDRDLQTLVNGLWAAGATAIGVNGQRISATTAIRTAGDAILVDYRPLSPPYAVTAVGDVRDSFSDSATARAFRTLKSSFGIRFDIRQEDRARLPAAPPVGLRYAREKAK